MGEREGEVEGGREGGGREKERERVKSEFGGKERECTCSLVQLYAITNTSLCSYKQRWG